ncbi:MAG: glycine C-acetyltransferase [Deltaproteobacteria bacterium]|nr:MAG: glycine C-acetyltransferase [Deltaproteobacteria bacterium]
MLSDKTRAIFDGILADIARAGLTKDERIIVSPQGADIAGAAADGPPKSVINFCANNYLGLSSHPRVTQAAREALETHGFGLSSVRFICGTQDLHKQLERRIADFLEMDDAILYSSCFDANGGLFETLLTAEDAVISDALNHASIIDGIRLCKAARYRYANGDMAELEQHLRATQDKRIRLIATDGVFSMDGFVANLPAICDLADKYDALVMVDDSHATGFMGARGKGTHEHCGVMGRVDIITSTLGKALGGAAGGFTAARAPIVALLRQRSRPYLFSNSLSPVIAGASIAVFDLLAETTELRDRLMTNARYFRDRLTAAGFDIVPGEHPIVPIMLGDARLAQRMAADLLDEGIYVIGFSYPVVPKGQARIRVQLSAAHTREHLDRAIAAFTKVGKALGVLA